MNKHLYRIVFNKARGLLMVVAENVRGCTKASGSGRGASPAVASTVVTLRPLRFALMSALGLISVVSPLAWADIVADHGAPPGQQPVIINAANGVPQVNIQAPSAAGVSHNSYSQFDVNAQGAILNNARTNTQTQLGGWVEGNAQLANGTARVILNEVNSSNPSQLRGYVEVAGDRAQVVIANPSGIACDGCGFINANRATLTSGNVQMQDGQLQGYRVEAGKVVISGKGLDASQTDYTDVIARSVEVNAGLWAKDLRVTSGANQVNADNTQATPINGSGETPQVAIDVAQLGGMYAGKIKLVGTEAGLGVRNAGQIGSSAGDVVINADGRLGNSGQISSSQNLQVDSAQGIDNSGSLYSKGDATLSSRGDINNQGVVAAQQNVNASARTVQGGRQSVWGAGVAADGTLDGNGALRVSASQGLNQQGSAVAAGDVHLSADTLDLKASQTAGRTVALTARAGDADLSDATVDAAGTLSASARNTLTTDRAKINAEGVQINAGRLSNRQGEIVQLGKDTTVIAVADALDNSEGRIASNATDVRLSGTRLTNAKGHIEHAGTGSLSLQGQTLQGGAGDIRSNGALQVAVAQAVLDGATTVARQIQIDADQLSNRQGTLLQTGSQTMRITTTGLLDNTGATLASDSDISLTADRVLNQDGTVQAAVTGSLDITARTQLDNDAGTLSAANGVRLATGQLRNGQGKVTAGDTLQVTGGQLNNDHGTLVSKGALTITGAALSNRQGTLGSADGSLGVTLSQSAFDNAAGVVQARQGVTLTSLGLNNTDGLINGATVRLDSAGLRLSNQRGAVVSSDTLDLRTGELDNQAGLIQAKGAMTLDTHGQALINTDSGTANGILGQAGVSLVTGSLNNSAGFIGSKGDVDVQATQVDNVAGGVLTSEQSILLTGDGLNNRGGQLQSLGDARLDMGSGRVDNLGGLLRAGGTLTVAADQLDNQNTQGNNQGVEGQSLDLKLGQLLNRSGALRADQTLSVQTRGQLDNSAGLISSSKQVTLRADQALLNGNGTMIAGDNISLTGASLSGDGSVLSLGDMHLDLASGLVNSGRLQANGDLQLNLQGALDNRALMQAGKHLQVSSNLIENREGGEISAAQVTLNAADSLTNRGLIDAQLTRINTQVLNNLGTGRVYGDRVSIAAGQLNNDVEGDRAAVIAARERLDLGVGTLVNREHAMLFSAGDLLIGGALDAQGQATGQATRVDNLSANIEALGALSLNTAALRNSNEHFSTHVVQVGKETLQEFQHTGSPNRYRPDQISLFKDEVSHLVSPEGVSDNYNRYDFTRTTTQTQILTSDPGQILAGGSLLLTANSVLNDKSHIIAGGALVGDIGQLDNTEVTGQETVTDRGTSSHLYRIHKKGRDNQGTSTAAYNPAASVTDIFLRATQYLENTAPIGSGLQVADRQVGSVAQAAAGAGAASVNLGAGRTLGAVLEVPALQAIAAGGVGESIRTGGVNTQLPNNSLFQINPQANPGYLVESDPRFTSYRSWLSSSYMLDRLQLDPGLTLTRLGDGFYEQKLIREQIAQLTGRRFLDGYANDETQYRALLDSALTYAGKWDLVPGVALSSEQMAQLTSDIVWLVKQDVTLADGSVTQALVPQVYVRVRDGDLDGSGALMAGNVVDLKLQGDLVNSGTIAGRSVLAISAANIQNLGGRLSGGDVEVRAGNDLNNLGGLIDANTRLNTVAGRDINLVSSTRDTQSEQGSATGISRVAGLFVSAAKGELVANAARDINLSAAQIISSGKDGKTTLVAGNDINLDTVTQSREQSVQWNSSNWRKEASRTDTGSVIQGQGDVRLVADRDLNAVGANVTSDQGGVTVATGRDVNLGTGERYNFVDEAHKVTGSNSLFSKKTTTTRDTLEETRAQATTLSGETTWVKAGNDINVRGSNVVSTSGTTLVAGNDVNVLAATDQLREEHFKDVKKSGLFSGGAIAVTIGSQQRSEKNTSDGQTAAASTVGATDGNVNILAGDRYQQVGSQVSAPKGDVDIAAQHVDILEARDQQHVSQETKFKQGGLTITVTNPVIETVRTAQRMKTASDRTDDGRLKTLALVNTAMGVGNGYIAYDQDPAMAGGINISISAGGSKQQSKSEQRANSAAGSSVLAGGDVNITAAGAGKDSNLVVQGSQITAGRDANLKADGSIDLLAAQNTVEQRSTEKGSSGSIGIGISLGGERNGLSFNAGASQNRGKANGDDLVWSNTHVDAGNRVALESGGDTRLKGAVVSGKQVTADVGGDLTVQSLQDVSTYEAKQTSLGVGVSICVPPFCMGTSSASFSQNKGVQTSNFQSVTEQSGIRAGDEGFDIRVNGNTDLAAGVIASNDKAIADGKNRLSTGTLTTSNLHNSSSASADSSGLTLSTDFVGQGMYGASKALLSNYLDAGKASDSSKGNTLSAVSDGNILITDAYRQQQLTGRDGEQTVASLNRDTANAHTEAGRQNLEKLQRTAEAEQTIKNEAYRQGVQFTDEAYRTMFRNPEKMYALILDEKGAPKMDDDGKPQFREVGAEERKHLQADDKNVVNVALNGIFNDDKAAAKYAAQHRDPNATGPQYFMWFPQAGNALSELLIAAYQKNMDNSFFGLTNYTAATQQLLIEYGATGLHLTEHSRGTMTGGNARQALYNTPGTAGMLSKTTVNNYGGAFNVYTADEQLAYLQNRASVTDAEQRANLVLKYQVHNNDPVGRWFFMGNNPGTGGVIPKDSNVFKELANVFTGATTVHSCYGSGASACARYWSNPSIPLLVPVTPRKQGD
ncbi:hemagglutinin repeat-containing protein [Pseudomonas sp. RP23018S]|uniref:two-partner secretion domain-containing protein n=1 Tax=Pseudomonas sp. RP23018S TaxID=3096037 RepID=UPI002ACA2AC4|nr:hemagglutinin repeat-containing protein [Pseudomonas sp. RP23018S]MDZ5604334.1 hemagglutinin repeat-containing protein [Pseudomonas sp. RP23018S]